MPEVTIGVFVARQSVLRVQVLLGYHCCRLQGVKIMPRVRRFSVATLILLAFTAVRVYTYVSGVYEAMLQT